MCCCPPTSPPPMASAAKQCIHREPPALALVFAKEGGMRQMQRLGSDRGIDHDATGTRPGRDIGGLSAGALVGGRSALARPSWSSSLGHRRLRRRRERKRRHHPSRVLPCGALWQRGWLWRVEPSQHERATVDRATLALEAAAVASEVVLGGVVVESDRIARRDRLACDETSREVFADDNLAVGVARVADEVIEVVGGERGGEEARSRSARRHLQARVEVGDLLLPQQQVGRQQHHQLAHGDRLGALEVPSDTRRVLHLKPPVRDEDGRLSVEQLQILSGRRLLQQQLPIDL
mmetsp:Transcript_32419/g.75594  ORF Transcript_32419/g.75594 Transcript_32419/m.75594 type:complete len:292 (+) Transcript_32419:688-1563(+)